jgi:hypothetical protein
MPDYWLDRFVREREDRKQDIGAAIEQNERASEKPPVPSAADDAEKNFWIWIGIWGPVLIAVFGSGVFAFVEEHPVWGVFLCLPSFVGLIFMTLHLKGHAVRWGYPLLAAVMALVTWVFLGTDIWHAYVSVPSQIQAAVAPLQTQLDSASQELRAIKKGLFDPREITYSYKNRPGDEADRLVKRYFDKPITVEVGFSNLSVSPDGNVRTLDFSTEFDVSVHCTSAVADQKIQTPVKGEIMVVRGTVVSADPGGILLKDCERW